MSIDEIPSAIKANKYITNDGSMGQKGSILDYIEDYIKAFRPEIIYSCGPLIVLEKVAQLAQKYSIESQVAMEKVMACGIGVCRGCVIKVYKDGEITNATVCKDGPVFKGDEVVWR
jgi:dihydroorotate dehydrogenase electron transfer subunit